MAKALQRRRGTTAEHANFTGLEGEFTYDTTEKRIVAHDGVTAGGIPMATKKEVEEVANSLDPRILDAASQSDILEAVSQATVGNTQEPPEGLMLSHVVGEEWHSFTGQIPVGGVPYCGQLVTREVYRDLWEYAQTQGLVKPESEWQSIASAQNGNVAFYSTGDGSTTFRMPSIKGYVKGASSQSEAGEYIAEGLPNITGHAYDNLAPSDAAQVSASGAMSAEVVSGARRVTAWVAAQNATNVASLSIDASRSNPIYGNSDNVTPETNAVLFGVFAFGGITNVGELDAPTVAAGLAKVEANISNIPVPVRYVVEKWSSGTEWYTKYNDGWKEQGGRTGHVTVGAEKTITFPLPFSDTNYTVSLTTKPTDNEREVNRIATVNQTLTTSSMVIRNNGWSTSYTGLECLWRVEGY